MTAPLTTRARAKVNLTLRILGRRADGYHELESLVAFAGVGDALTLEPGEALSLAISGPRSAGLSAEDNLVLHAARALSDACPGLRLGRFHLVKRLPVASGIGGGSADAAAALRLLARLNGLSLSEPKVMSVAAKTGADVPVCLDSRARGMAGIGERLGPLLRLPPLFAVLVNPGVPIETAAVFRELGLAKGASLSPPGEVAELHHAGGSAKSLIPLLSRSGNDLEAPALRVAPVLPSVLERLAALPACRLARMSGSGATCFALFDDCRQSAAAARLLAAERPDWWVKPTVLR